MKLIHNIFKISTILFALIFVNGCEDSDSGDGIAPEHSGANEKIIASPSETITFNGTFSDKDGLRSINIKCDDLKLDKTITFANHVEKYYLEYNFKIADDAATNVYPVEITTTSTEGLTDNYSVTLDIASKPEAALPSNCSVEAGKSLNLTGNITDKQGIKSIKISHAVLKIDKTIELTDSPKSYDINETFDIDNEANSSKYSVAIEVTNVKDRKKSFNIDVQVTGSNKVYDNIYIAGTVQWDPNNPAKAYVMDKDANDDKWFETIISGWADYDQIKFLGQTAWTPDNWGLQDASNPSKGMVNAESSAMIDLNATGNPDYYKVRFNPYTKEYNVEKLTNDLSARTEMYIVGNGYPDYPELNWNTDKAIAMTPNYKGYGEHIFGIEGLKFSDDVSLKFVGQNDGSWAYDAGFVEGGEVTAPISWRKIKEGSGSADLKFKEQAGSYTVIYDYFAKRAIIWKE